jgi:hypothetical protein
VKADFPSSRHLSQHTLIIYSEWTVGVAAGDFQASFSYEGIMQAFEWEHKEMFWVPGSPTYTDDPHIWTPLLSLEVAVVPDLVGFGPLDPLLVVFSKKP